MAEATIVDARTIDDPESLTVALQALHDGHRRPARAPRPSSDELADLAAATGDPGARCYASANQLRALVDARAGSTRPPTPSSATAGPERARALRHLPVHDDRPSRPCSTLAAGRFAEAEAAAERGQELAVVQ